MDKIVNHIDGLTIGQHLILLEMIDDLIERYADYECILVDRWFPVTDLVSPAVIGSFAITSQQTKTKWMLKSHAIYWDYGYCTPGDLARSYLSVKYPKRKGRVSTNQYHDMVVPSLHAPNYAIEDERIPDCVYVDIQSAYWSIVLALGWDVDYYPPKWINKVSSNDDFPFPSVKLARNCLVSMGLSGNMRIWTGSELIFQKKPNKFRNKLIWRACMDVLNGVADDMTAIAEYCYSDGYIIRHKDLRIADEIIQSWGLNFRIKHTGDAHILGRGSYRVGDYKSKPYEHQKGRGFFRVEDVPYKEFLKTRLRAYSEFSKDLLYKAHNFLYDEI